MHLALLYLPLIILFRRRVVEESFRSAFRKFTGRSVVELKASHHRLQILERIGIEFDPSYTILLKENLDSIQDDPTHPKESVSEAPVENSQAQSEYGQLSSDLRAQFSEFRSKWAQRYSVDEFVARLEMGKWIVEEEKGFRLNLSTKAKDLKDFYLHDIHLMVGDAEKLVVTTCSRCIKIQNKITQAWYQTMKENGGGELKPISRLLPSLELGLREMEERELRRVRDAVKLLAEKRFRDGVKKAGSHYYKTPQAVYRNLGGTWNTLGIWDTGFRAYMEEFVDFCQGICLEIILWYQRKWILFTRGWSLGQLELFEKEEG